ncbi:MAG TPA: DUF6356 family protein [Bacteroidales bacterium]|jgi:hypothetical protein|nr:DUF6356 family protein [Bacteroidales bacterium]
MPDMLRKFKEHPAEAGMTYGEHFWFAIKLAGYSFKAALASVIHAFLPFLLKKTASTTIFEQYARVKDRLAVDFRKEKTTGGGDLS